MQYVLIKSFISFEGLICPCDNGRGVAAYTLSRHGVHIGRLKKNGNKIKTWHSIYLFLNFIVYTRFYVSFGKSFGLSLL
jgi:hypothetical protein